MTRLSRITFVILLSIFALSACGGGGGSGGNNQQPLPPVDTDLDWDQGNWDEENWQ